MKFYVLNEDNTISESDSPEHVGKIIARDTCSLSVGGRKMGNVSVSTIFLGINHGTEEHPLLFETMIFGGEADGYRERCATYEAALFMHEKAKVELQLAYK